MAASNRVKRNISFALTVLGCIIIIARIIDPIMSHMITGWNLFEILGATVITYCMFNNFNIYRKRVNDSIMFGRRQHR